MGEYRKLITRTALALDRATIVTRNDPACGAEEMVKDLKAQVFAEQPIHYLASSVSGCEVKLL